MPQGLRVMVRTSGEEKEGGASQTTADQALPPRALAALSALTDGSDGLPMIMRKRVSVCTRILSEWRPNVFLGPHKRSCDCHLEKKKKVVF